MGGAASDGPTFLSFFGVVLLSLFNGAAFPSFFGVVLVAPRSSSGGADFPLGGTAFSSPSWVCCFLLASFWGGAAVRLKVFSR